MAPQYTARRSRNKLEARNPKLETISSHKNTNDPNEFKTKQEILLTKFQEIER
jgi:hypothetical protein